MLLHVIMVLPMHICSGEFRILPQGMPLKKISIQFGKSFSNSVIVVLYIFGC
jgi:hypothetical protein